MRHLRLPTFVALLLLALASPVFASDIVTREFESSVLERKWSYAVYLPSGYESSGLHYPVLYLLHGNGQNLNSWVRDGRIQPTVDALIEHKEMPPAIIVMPDAGTTWFVDRKEKMETAFLRDLIPDVEREFRTITTRSGRLIAGLSMGAYGAMRFALKYPEMFAAAGLLSPAIYDPLPPDEFERAPRRRVRCAGFRSGDLEESELSGAVGCVSREEAARADVHHAPATTMSISSNRTPPSSTRCYARTGSRPNYASWTAHTHGRSGRARSGTRCAMFSATPRPRAAEPAVEN